MALAPMYQAPPECPPGKKGLLRALRQGGLEGTEDRPSLFNDVAPGASELPSPPLSSSWAQVSGPNHQGPPQGCVQLWLRRL